MKLTRRTLLGSAAAAGLLPRASRAQGNVRLRMSWWGGNDVHRAQLAVIRRFESLHPGIEVKTEYTGWVGHLERLTTQIAGGTAPDVMQINWYWLVLFSRDGQGFLDLATLADVIDLSQFDEGSLSMGRVKGRLNALPLAMAARLFYFNATTFERARLPLPSSWDELFAAGPLFRERLGPDWFPLDLTLQDVMALSRSWLIQGRPVPFVDEPGRRLSGTQADMTEAAALYQKLVDQHVIPSARERASHGYVAQQEMRPWITGRYAGVYQWVSAIGKSADTLAPGQRVALAPYPMRAGALDAGLLYRPAMMNCINRGTAHPREAALLVNFLLSDPEAAEIMGLRRGVPVSRSALAALEAQGELQGLAWEGMQQIATLPNAVRESGWFEHPRFRDGFVDVMEELGYGRIGVEQAGGELYTDLNAILQRIMR